MKLKLLYQNKDILLLIKKESSHFRFYYADGHNEVSLDDMTSQIHKVNTGYKKPIHTQEQFLYPTGDYHQEGCLWVNLDAFIKHSLKYLSLLPSHRIRAKVRKMYLKHLDNVLIGQGFY